MNGSEFLVIGVAIALIALVNWYFFVAGRSPTALATTEAVIEVAGGYAPNTVRVKAGRPVRLIFDRRDDNPCSEEVVIPDFGVRKFLPNGERTTIEITPTAAGRYGFTCGMSMLRGTIVAED